MSSGPPGPPGPGPRGRVIGHVRTNRVSVATVAPRWTLTSVVTLRIHELARIVAEGGAGDSQPSHLQG
jgi:hypothetical protein